MIMPEIVGRAIGPSRLAGQLGQRRLESTVERAPSEIEGVGWNGAFVVLI
jgi:hypothetical protein